MNKGERAILIAEFEQWLKSKKLKFEKEVPFSKIMDTKRKFRADYLITNLPYYDESTWPFGTLTKKVIFEINGGQWTQGRHNRGGKGYENDLTKSNIANKNGFEYYSFTYEMLKRQEYKNYL